jgi:two-component system chemotaxis sensor kinase CheA
MDVVKRQIESLRGSVTISSDKGRGTTIALTLPLTLAIIDGLLVETAGQQYILPMSIVAENVELRREDRLRNNSRNTVAVRGSLVPYIDVRRLFALDHDEPDIEKVVIVRHESQRVGLVVDRVIGSHQTVIQSLGKFFAGVEAFSGATIMGDGRVTLILDIAAVVRLANCPSPLGRAA